MSRGIRRDTPDRIAAARERLPRELGPWLGDVAIRFNMSAGMVAKVVGAHEQTVLRWFFGQSTMQPYWLKASMKLVALLAWMESVSKSPLSGTPPEKMQQLVAYSKEFVRLTKSAP